MTCRLTNCCLDFAQVRNSAKTPLLTALLEGPAGTGKTALAASMGIDSDFPFVKVRLSKGRLHQRNDTFD